MFEIDRRIMPKNSLSVIDKRQKTVTRTFRIRADWDAVLKEEAERQGVSVNVLMNMILRRYALFDRWARGYNMISLTQPTFRNVLDSVPLENLALVGQKSGPSDVQNILDMIGLPSDYSSFVYLLSDHFGGSDYAMWFSCFHHRHENKDVFHLQHNLGLRWSVYLEKYLLSSLKSLTKIDGDATVYDYALNLKIPRVHMR